MPNLLLAVGVLIALAGRADALATGGIAGRVTDETGAALPGVTGEVEKPEPAEAKVGVTDRGGAYALRDLSPGVYRVSFRLLNFAGVVRAGIAVAEGRTAVADAVMHLSASADV